MYIHYTLVVNPVSLAEKLKYWDNVTVYVFDTLITDWDAVEDELNRIEEAGVKVIVVDKECA